MCQDGTRLGYSPDRVIHIRLAAWESGSQGLLGEGLIRALSADLSAEAAATKMTARTAATGRPSAIFSPADNTALTGAQQKGIADSYDRLVAEGRNAMVLPGEMSVVFPNLTPRDLEFATQRMMTRDAVLAAFGVPPSRVGLPTANYATSQQQSLIYWTHLQSLSRMLDAAFTKIATRFDMSYEITHDYAGVAALQDARTAQLARVKSWVELGAEPAAAAAYEGLADGPLTIAKRLRL
jgi:phage portal protein BeeE